MRAMMRMKSGIFIALSVTLAFVISCAASSTEDEGDDMMGGGGGNDPVCGDGTCASSEVGYCPSDCGSGGGGGNNAVCGNGTCETTKGENASSCFSDCGAGNGSGSGSGSGSNTMCPSDPFACFGCMLDPMLCPAGLDQTACQACLGGGLGSGSGLPFP
jgi:hypothetical protein